MARGAPAPVVLGETPKVNEAKTIFPFGFPKKAG